MSANDKKIVVKNILEGAVIITTFSCLIYVLGQTELTVLFGVTTVIGIVGTLWLFSAPYSVMMRHIKNHNTKRLRYLMRMESECEEAVYETSVATMEFFNRASCAGVFVVIIYISEFLSKFPDSWHKFVAYLMLATLATWCSVLVMLSRQNKIREVHKELKGLVVENDR